MNAKDVVTTFSVEEKATGKGVTISALIRALNDHTKTLLKGESFCDRTQWDEGRKNERIPARFRALDFVNLIWPLLTVSFGPT